MLGYTLPSWVALLYVTEAGQLGRNCSESSTERLCGGKGSLQVAHTDMQVVIYFGARRNQTLDILADQAQLVVWGAIYLHCTAFCLHQILV